MRLPSCSATPSATRLASSSGRWISMIFMRTGLPVSFSRSSRNLSTLAPFLPIRMPGRAVCRNTVISSPVRSISTFGMAANAHSLRMKRRIFWSSPRNLAKSFLVAYQRERQGSVTAMRKPVGCVFCPMVLLVVAAGGAGAGRRRLGVDDVDVDVAGAALDRHRPALRTGPGAEAAGQQRPVLRERARDAQPVGAHARVLQRVGDGRRQHLVDVARGAVAVVAQVVEGLVDRAAADQREHAARLVDAHARVAVDCAGFVAHVGGVGSFLLCPRKVRVGENSPSRWPTMSSVTYTFRNTRPLWTMNVCPTNSGTMTLGRDHVWIGSFAPFLFMASTFFISFALMNGPFLMLRLISSCS